MTNPITRLKEQPRMSGQPGHALWVRSTHWIAAASFLTLVFTGFMILMVHPRLYWGEVGNDLTEAWLELPISRNLDHEGTRDVAAIFEGDDSRVRAVVEYDQFNQNGWGRSLHFLAAWFLVLTGVVYLIWGAVTGHFRKHIVPRGLTLGSLAHEVGEHVRLRIRPATGGPQYGLLQRTAYWSVVFIALPLVVVTGLGMSPAISASFPFLQGMFGGLQSTRSVHFLAFAALLAFALGHVAMVALSGFRRQIRAMTIGDK